MATPPVLTAPLTVSALLSLHASIVRLARRVLALVPALSPDHRQAASTLMPDFLHDRHLRLVRFSLPRLLLLLLLLVLFLLLALRAAGGKVGPFPRLDSLRSSSLPLWRVVSQLHLASSCLVVAQNSQVTTRFQHAAYSIVSLLQHKVTVLGLCLKILAVLLRFRLINGPLISRIVPLQVFVAWASLSLVYFS